ncbi:unnamed protein product, partial [Amoebophrya sp. A120]
QDEEQSDQEDEEQMDSDSSLISRRGPEAFDKGEASSWEAHNVDAEHFRQPEDPHVVTATATVSEGVENKLIRTTSSSGGRREEVSAAVQKDGIVHRMLCNMVRSQFLHKGGEAGKDTLKRITLAGFESQDGDATEAAAFEDIMSEGQDETEEDFLYHYWCKKIKSMVHAGEIVNDLAFKENNAGHLFGTNTTTTLVVPARQDDGGEELRAAFFRRSGTYNSSRTNTSAEQTETAASSPSLRFFTAQGILLEEGTTVGEGGSREHGEVSTFATVSVRAPEKVPHSRYHGRTIGSATARNKSALDEDRHIGSSDAAVIAGDTANNGTFGVPGEPPRRGQVVKKISCTGDDLMQSVLKAQDQQEEHESSSANDGAGEEGKQPVNWCDRIAEEVLMNIFLTHAANTCVAKLTRVVFFLESAAESPDEPTYIGDDLQGRRNHRDFLVFALFLERLDLFEQNGKKPSREVSQNLISRHGPEVPERLIRSLYGCLDKFSKIGFVHNDVIVEHVGRRILEHDRNGEHDDLGTTDLKFTDLSESSFVALKKVEQKIGMNTGDEGTKRDRAGVAELQSTGRIVFGKMVVVNGDVTPVLGGVDSCNPLLCSTVRVLLDENNKLPAEQRMELAGVDVPCNAIGGSSGDGGLGRRIEGRNYGPAFDWYGGALALILFLDSGPPLQNAMQNGTSWATIVNQDVTNFGLSNARKGCALEMTEATVFPIISHTAGDDSAVKLLEMNTSELNTLGLMEKSLRENAKLLPELSEILLLPIRNFGDPEDAKRKTLVRLEDFFSRQHGLVAGVSDEAVGRFGDKAGRNNSALSQPTGYPFHARWTDPDRTVAVVRSNRLTEGPTTTTAVDRWLLRWATAARRENPKPSAAHPRSKYLTWLTKTVPRAAAKKGLGAVANR